MTVATSKLDAFLDLLSIGVPVVAEHTPTPARPVQCSCNRADCKKPGKHPRTMNGSHDATRDEAQVRRWLGLWPAANPGTDAELARLVIVAPDSPEWDAEFQRRGLETPAIVQSGGGEGHKQYWFRRPADIPAVNINKPDEYDILAAGNVVMPGAEHVSGRRYTWIRRPDSIDDLPEPPAWVRDELLQVAARRSTYTPPASDEDEPIVRLRPRGMQRWRGELVEHKPDGTVDHSTSLFFIGLELADAGASRRGIVEELARRDIALGWRKYTDRPDAAKRYGVIAGKAVTSALEREQTEAVAAAPTPPTAADPDRVTIPRSEYQNLRDRLADYWTLIVQQHHILGNNSFTPAERVTFCGTLIEMFQAEEQQPGEWHVMHRGLISKRYGVSKDLAGRAFARLEALGVIEKDSKHELVEVDFKTGDRLPKPEPHIITRVRPLVSKTDAWATVASVDDPRPARAKVPKGAPVCPLHPDAETVLKHVCTVCQRPTDALNPTADVGFDAEPALCTKKSPIGTRHTSVSPPSSTDENIVHREPAIAAAYQNGQETLLLYGAMLDWMPVEFKQGYSIPMGEENWRRFAELANGDLGQALDAARRQVDLVREYGF